jgi:hypothetical protein
MNVVPFEKKLLNEWENFVENSNNGTIFHTRKFLSYHKPDKFKDGSLMFYEKDKLVGLFPAAVIKRKFEPGPPFKNNFDYSEKITLSSHQGASFGGFVYKDSLSLKQAFLLVESLIEYSDNNGYQRIHLTHSPFVYQKRYSNYVDFAMMSNGFKFMKREVSSIIRLDVEEDNVLALFKPEARTAVRKAEKSGVIIKKSEDFDNYYKILKNNLNLRHGVQPAHTLDELILLSKMFPEEIFLVGAYIDNKLIAGVVNFISNEKAVIVFYISHDPEYQNYRAVNLLFHHILRDSIKRNLKYLDFGLFTVNMDPNWGLGKFKENFGARGILRDSFYLDLK